MIVQLSLYAAAAFASAAALLVAVKAAAQRRRRVPVRLGSHRPGKPATMLVGAAALCLGLSACTESSTGNGDERATDSTDSAKTQQAAEIEADTAKNAQPVYVTDEKHFASVTAEGRVLVDFYADWCGPCKALAPILKKVAQENAGALTVAKVDVDEHGGLAKQYGVRGIPHLVLFENGKAVDSVTGFRSKKNLDNWLN